MNLKEVIFSIPQQIKGSLKLENENALPNKISSLLVCGMGGSGILGELLKSLVGKVRINTHHTYGLPENVEPGALVIVVSYSGKTKETISAYEEALERKLPVLIITSNGILLKEAKEKNLPYIQLPHIEGIPTRFMTGYLIKAGYEVMEKVGAVESAEKITKGIEKEITTNWGNVARTLADQIQDKTVLIYVSSNLYGVGYIWKEALNETGKVPAFLNVVPEMNHNEIESLGSIKDKIALFLIDPQEESEITNRFALMAEVFNQKGWEFREINLSHPDRLVDTVNTLTLAFDTSIIIAQRKGIDPLATPIMDELKKELGQ